MNSRKLLLVLGAAGSLAAVGAFAQNAPSPVPESAPTNEIAAPARADRIIYSTHLPTVQQLMQTAQAQRTTVLNVNQTETEISVTYRFGDNSTRTISYQLLPEHVSNASSAEPVAPVMQAPPPPPQQVQVVEVPVPAPETRVIYRYYDRYDPFYYDPFYWPRPAPVSVSLGFGWDFGRRHHYHHPYHRHGGRRW